MAHVILFHHAQGLTPGVHAFAAALRSAGHTVDVPDLYDGATFDDLQAGVDHAERIGLDEITARGVAAAGDAGAGIVFAGMSLGVLPAQKLARTRAGAAGAVLISGSVPATAFGDRPGGVPMQLHVMADDEWGDVDVARQHAAAGAELFVYPGDRHLFVDSSLPAHDPAAAELVVERVLRFLADTDGRTA